MVVAQYLVMPHVRHICVLLPLKVLHVRYAQLGLYIGVRLEGRTTRIWYFGCGLACATTMGCSGFKLSFGTIIVL